MDETAAATDETAHLCLCAAVDLEPFGVALLVRSGRRRSFEIVHLVAGIAQMCKGSDPGFKPAVSYSFLLYAHSSCFRVIVKS